MSFLRNHYVPGNKNTPVMTRGRNQYTWVFEIVTRDAIGPQPLFLLWMGDRLPLTWLPSRHQRKLVVIQMRNSVKLVMLCWRRHLGKRKEEMPLAARFPSPWWRWSHKTPEGPHLRPAMNSPISSFLAHVPYQSTWGAQWPLCDLPLTAKLGRTKKNQMHRCLSSPSRTCRSTSHTQACTDFHFVSKSFFAAFLLFVVLLLCLGQCLNLAPKEPRNVPFTDNRLFSLWFWKKGTIWEKCWETNLLWCGQGFFHWWLLLLLH